MAHPRDMNVVTAIKAKHGRVIDLEKSPMVIIEIIHNYRHLIDEGGNGRARWAALPARHHLHRPNVGTSGLRPC